QALVDLEDVKIIESIPDKEKPPLLFGPTIDSLKGYCWKVKCPPKIKHFLWQLLSWCIAVKERLRTRGIQWDICCVRCGAPGESINHVFFECPNCLSMCSLKDTIKSYYLPN